MSRQPSIPPMISDLLQNLLAAVSGSGVEMHLVGGMVRDGLSGVSDFSFDLDFVVVGDAHQVAREVAKRLGGRFTLFERFLTAKVVVPIGDLSRGDPSLGGRDFEVDFVTARHERYERPGALPTVERGTFDDDLRRRDFTVNALALPMAEFAARVRAGSWPGGISEVVIDRVGGISDLSAKLIRIFHGGSFVDDPTRLFRAVRYASRIGGILEPETARAAEQAIRGGALGTVSAVRRLREIEKYCAEPTCIPLFQHARDLGLLGSTPLSALNHWDEFLHAASELVRNGVVAPERFLLEAYRRSEPGRRESLFAEYGFGAKRIAKLEREVGACAAGSSRPER